MSYQFEAFLNLSNAFPGGQFDQVRWLTMSDHCPFEHELFQIVTRDFPFVRTLTIFNSEEQENKQQTFPYLVTLHLASAHSDYTTQFLLETSSHLPRFKSLEIEYEVLATITNNFTNFLCCNDWFVYILRITQRKKESNNIRLIILFVSKVVLISLISHICSSSMFDVVFIEYTHSFTQVCCRKQRDIIYFNMGGCCTSSARVPTEAEMTELEIFLSGIPDYCREIINNLPPQQLFHAYRCHRVALNHGLKRHWSLAIFYEHCAIKKLQVLLPTHKDHYTFFYFYRVLSAAFLALGELESAIESIQITLAILLKYTPEDYQAISKHYYYLAIAFKGLRDSRGTTKYLIKAVETARSITDLDPEYIPMLENELQLAK